MRTVIAHISDIHAERSGYSNELARNVIQFINDINPEIVIVTGDLTDDGYLHEYESSLNFLCKIETSKMLVVPGNHDSRNLGYEIFEEIFGSRYMYIKTRHLCVQGIDSSEPDIDDGHIGRLAYRIVRERLSECNGIKIVALHHHLVPIPGTGRERNVPVDAGDFLQTLIDVGANIVLSGHKHIPWIWNLNGMYIVHAGTATTYRLKAGIKPSFNIIEIIDNDIKIFLVNSDNLKKRLLYSGTISNPIHFIAGLEEQLSHNTMIQKMKEKWRSKGAT